MKRVIFGIVAAVIVVAALFGVGGMAYRMGVAQGAGYAALNSFASLRPDVAKLDMAIVRGVDLQPLSAQAKRIAQALDPARLDPARAGRREHEADRVHAEFHRQPDVAGAGESAELDPGTHAAL